MKQENPGAALAKKIALPLGLLWLFGAFALFYSHRPLHEYLLFHLRTPVAWIDQLSAGWEGMPWEVLTQGSLLLLIAALAAFYGFKIMGWIYPAAPSSRAEGEENPLPDAPGNNDTAPERDNTSPGGLDRAVWGAGLALGILGNAVFLLGLIGALAHARSIFLFLTFLACVPAALALPRLRRAATFPRPASALATALWAFLGLLYLLTLLYALTPPVQSDALRYHMAAPQEWLKAGRITYLPCNAFSNFPFLVEMLFLFGMGLAGDLLGQAMHFLYLPLNAGAAALLTREILRQIPSRDTPSDTTKTRLPLPPEFLAAFLFSTLPIATPLAAWAFIDHAVAFHTFGMIYFLLRWIRLRQTREWALAAAMGGMLCASKYTGVVPVFFGGAALALGTLLLPDNGANGALQKQLKLFPALARMVAFGLIACAIAAPWWIKNTIYTHNPVYPMANNLFKGGEWTKDNADFYSGKLKEKGIADIHGIKPKIINILKLPWLTAAYSDRFEAFEIGPLFWVVWPWVLAWSLLALWNWRARPGPALLALWIFFLALFWYFTYQSNRFLLPFWLLSCVVASVMAASLRPGAIRALFLAGLALPALYGSADSVRWLLLDTGRIQSRPDGTAVCNTLWPTYTLGFLKEPEFLARQINYAPSADYASRLLTPRDKVLLLGDFRKLHWKCRVESHDWFDQPLIKLYLTKAATPGALLDTLKAAGFTHIFLNLEEWGWPGDRRALTGEIPTPPGTAWFYNRRFFTPEQLLLLDGLIQSPRLKTVQTTKPGRIYLTRIN